MKQQITQEQWNELNYKQQTEFMKKVSMSVSCLFQKVSATFTSHNII